MKNKIIAFILVTLLSLSLTSAVFAESLQTEKFKSPEGGYTLNIPAAKSRIDVLRGSNNLRFYFQDQLVTIDIYDKPSNITSLQIKDYTPGEIEILDKLLITSQDYPDYTKSTSTILEVNGNIMYKALLVHDSSIITYRNNTIVGAIPSDENKILIIAVNFSERSLEQAEKYFSQLCATLEVKKPKAAKNNLLVNLESGYSAELPLGWHVKTHNSDNIIVASEVEHEDKDNAMIRAFNTKVYGNFAKASPEEQEKLTKAFYTKIAKFADSDEIKNCSSIIIDGLKGVLVEREETVDEQKNYYLDCYLFTTDKGYQLKYSTSDSINYPTKLKAFRNSINSFKIQRK